MESEFPLIAALIRLSRYVDDFAELSREKGVLKKMAMEGDEEFAWIGLICKGWTFSGEDTLEIVSKGSSFIGVAGQKWWPRLDVVFPYPNFILDQFVGVKLMRMFHDSVGSEKIWKDLCLRNSLGRWLFPRLLLSGIY